MTDSNKAIPPVDVDYVPPEMEEVLNEAWQHGIFTKGNMAREYANPIGEAACKGWLTTEASPGIFGNKWLITEKGLGALNAGRSSNADRSSNGEGC